VLYRRSRLYQEEYNAGGQKPGSGDDAAIEKSIRRATDAILRFERMKNPAGEVRANSLLIRALIDARKLWDADRQIVKAWELLKANEAQIGKEYVPPLIGRITLSQAVWHRAVWNEDRSGNRAQKQHADEKWRDAHMLFERINDGRSVLECEKLRVKWDSEK
jgi:hypothetical protein